MNESDDRALLETARAALERTAAGHREAYDIAPTDEQAMHHLVAELQTRGSAATLANLDTTEPLARLGAEAIYAGHRALQREAEGWRNLTTVAATDGWRAEFEARAGESQRQADAVLALRQRLADRDQIAQQESEAER
jgi:hypothetical protein